MVGQVVEVGVGAGIVEVLVGAVIAVASVGVSVIVADLALPEKVTRKAQKLIFYYDGS